MRLLAAPEGTTAGAAGLALGKSKSIAHEYLTALRDRGIAELTGGGRGSRFRLASARSRPPRLSPGRTSPSRTSPRPSHDGLVDATGEQRAVLEKAWQIADRPRLTLVQGGGGDRP